MNDRPDLTTYTNGTASPARRPGPPPENQRDPVDPVPTPEPTPTPQTPTINRPAGRLAAEPTVQLNTRISLNARDQLNELVTDWSGSQPTIRNVIEDLIAAAHGQRAS